MSQPPAEVLPPPTDIVETEGCETAPTWRIGYRIYRHSSHGDLPDGVYQKLVQEAMDFVNLVGDFSRCGLRVKIDIFDMGDIDYETDSQGFAIGSGSFIAAGGYDGAFYVFPGDEPVYSGWTGDNPGTNYATSYFPHNLDTDANEAQAWSLFLMHEWLHQVVGFYSQVNWPSNDVHGALEHGYIDGNPNVNPDYFRDMMSGNVMEGNKKTGITPGQYAEYGVPSNPN